jgi:hypothetical protein
VFTARYGPGVLNVIQANPGFYRVKIVSNNTENGR